MPAPVANPDLLVAARNRGVTYFTSTLLRNDDDEVPMTLTVTAVHALTGGSVQLNPDGTLTFTPDADFVGAASFEYTVRDEAGLTSVGTVTVDVRDVEVPGTGPLLGTIVDGTYYRHDGTSAGELIVGRSINDTLYGMAGNDLLLGGDGDDYLDLGAGDDRAFGEGGDDYFSSGDRGSAQMFGGAGNDRFFARRNNNIADSILMDGGEGNDNFHFDAWGIAQSLTLLGGAGNDIFEIENGGLAMIDAGEGDDIIAIGSFTGAHFTVTLGGGADWLILGSGYYSSYGGLVTTVTDFVAGGSGDRVDVELLAHYGSTWDGASNPFATGWLRLVQRGADVALQIDGNGGGNSYRDALIFENMTVGALLPYNIGFSGDGGDTPGETIDGTGNADRITTSDGDDTLRGLGGSDVLVGGAGDDHIDGGSGNDTLEGRSGSDVLIGGTDDDILRDLFSGDDQLFGGEGRDLLEVEHSGSPSSTVLLDGGNGNDELRFYSSPGYPLPTEQVATILGGDGNDYISTGFGSRIVIDAGAGDDSLYLAMDAGELIVTLGAGRDEIELHNGPRFNEIRVTDFEAGANGDFLDVPHLVSRMTNIAAGANPFSTGHLRLIQSGSDTLVDIDFDGGAQWQTLFRLENVVATEMTADNLFGFSPGAVGDNIYFISDPSAQVIEWLGGGNDTVVTSVGYSLLPDAEIERLQTSDPSSTAAFDLVGSDLNNEIYGNDGANILNGRAGNDMLSGLGGADTLIGGAGADELRGGAGDDRYFLDNVSDRVIEIAGEGRDRVFTSVSFALAAGADIEFLQAADQFSTTALNLSGSSIDNFIYGNNGVNVLSGAGGADVLYGYAGNDTLRGGTGLDITNGGAGDDSHFVDSASDIVQEAAGEGRDFVFTSASYTLRPGVDVELLLVEDRAGSTAINLTGNEVANILHGNNGANILNGNGDADVLLGYAGNDILVGGAGVDITNGGLGDDIHYVDSRDDVAVEAWGEGRDAVFASVSYTLREAYEVELLLTQNANGTEAINFTGNSSANTLQGNAGANILTGNGGDDTLIGNGGNDTLIGGYGLDFMNGGSGNDIYFVDDLGDLVIESAGGGHDVLFATFSYFLRDGQDIEVLVAENRSSTNILSLAGNGIANTIHGNDGMTWLDGGGGNDVLVGYAGDDTYMFTTALGAGNVDTLVGFVPGSDRIAMDDAVFTGLVSGALSANAFVVGSTAADADDRIIYNAATGSLFFDADGNGAGAAVQFAILPTGLPLAASDFVVI